MVRLVLGLACLLYVRCQFGEGKHPRGVDDDGKPQASDEREGDFRGDTDADRRVGLLQRFGPDPQVIAPIMFARKGEALLSPRLDDYLQVLVEPLSALGEGGVEAIMRVRKRAPPPAELAPALTDGVPGGDALGVVDRMGQG